MKRVAFSMVLTALVGGLLGTSTAWASTNSNLEVGPKVIFEKSPTTNLNVLRDRAIHGITDAPGLLTVKSGVVGKNSKNLNAKSFTTAEKVKETIDSNGTKVTTYHVTTFNEISPASSTNYGPSQWDSSYSWENVLNQDVATFQDNQGATWGTLLDGNAEWDTGGQTTNVPTISNAIEKYGEEGIEYGGGTVPGSDHITMTIGTPIQYHQYSYDSSSYGWPYVAFINGDCKTVGQATLTYSDGSTETWWNLDQWGNGVSNPF